MPSSTTQWPSIRMASHGICTLFPVKINRSPGTRKRDSSSWTPAESVRKQSGVRFFPTKTQSNIYLNWKSMKKATRAYIKRRPFLNLHSKSANNKKKKAIIILRKIKIFVWRENKWAKKNSENMFETYITDKRLIFLIKSLEKRNLANNYIVKTAGDVNR